MARKKLIEDRRERIVTTADQLFSYYGYEKTTLEDIARVIGISKASIYLEFNSKEDILLAVIRGFMEQQLKNMQQQAASSNAAPLLVLKNLLCEHFLAVYDRVTNQAHTPTNLALTSLRVKTEMRDLFLQFHSVIAILLERAAQRGEIQPQPNYPALAELIGKGLQACCPPYIAGGSRADVAELSESLLTLMLAGLQVSNPPIPASFIPVSSV